ncbi:MAG: hypothetical protein JNK78_16185 [Planctomycetes bacterium]|nr:hypothetical protein [Planctomycetota bacterium]
MIRSIAVSFSVAFGALAQQPTDAPDRTPSDFIRFVRVDDGGHLDTAITTYRRDDVELTLFGAVHIADKACYEALNDRFTSCDALLYELVGPADYRPSKEREHEGFNPIGLLQRGLENSLELHFQLDSVDYSPSNFVHADMTPSEFEQSMEDRGESLLTIMLDMMGSGMAAQRAKAEDGEPAPPPLDLVKAFRGGEGRHALRMQFAAQFEDMEAMVAGGKSGTLLQGRNEKCLRVLAREIDAGKKRIGIYYGAAHLPHMEQRLVGDLGFRKVAHEWLVAWDCKKRPDVKFDRAVVKLRQECRAQLRVLAAAAREYRLAADSSGPVTIDVLAAERAGGAPYYAGPKVDPWGRAWIVRKRAVGTRWEVASAAQDGTLGTDDDMIEQEPRRP